MLVAFQGRSGDSKDVAGSTETPSKAPSRNSSVLKEPEGSDLLVNSSLPRLEEGKGALWEEILGDLRRGRLP